MMGLLCLQNEGKGTVNPLLWLTLKEHKIKAAKLFWKSTYGKQYVPTLAVPFLKSQEKYQDLFNENLDSRIRFWLFSMRVKNPVLWQGFWKGLFWGRVMEWRVTINIALAVTSIFSFAPVCFPIALLRSLTHSLGDYWLWGVILVLVLKSALGDFRKKSVWSHP